MLTHIIHYVVAAAEEEVVAVEDEVAEEVDVVDAGAVV